MNILIATPHPKEARRMARVLGGLGHTHAIAASPEEVLACVTRCRPDVVLVGSLSTPWIHALDAVEGPHIYRIATVGTLDAATVAEVWNAGFDDVTRKCACPADLAGRIAALDRIRGWLHTMGDAFAEGHSDDLMASPLVLELGEALGDEFGAMIGGSLAATRAEAVGSLAYVAEIPLTLAAEGTEVTLGIGVTEETADAFGTLLFGEPVDRDAMADAVREFANTAGGVMKRSALDHGRTFSVGLPTDVVFPDPPAGSPIWHLQGEGIDLVAWAVQEDEGPRRITANMLTEGMVLTQPVLNGSGVMLVQAGAVLTQRTVSRLLELLGPGTLVEVARAA